MVPIPATGALWQSVMNDERTSKMKAATKKREMTPSGRRRGRIVRAGAAVAAGLVAAGALAACGGSSEKVSVSDPWVRVTPGSKDMTAAYMVIESEQADRLVAAAGAVAAGVTGITGEGAAASGTLVVVGCRWDRHCGRGSAGAWLGWGWRPRRRRRQ